MTSRRTFSTAIGAALLALSTRLPAQSQPTMRRVGYLSPFSRADVEQMLSRLRSELEKLGWVDGLNIVLLDPRTTEGRNERLPSAAGEVVAQNPDLILVQTQPGTRALMQATRSIPIVMIGVGDPVGYGIVADYANPGGNVTGSSYLADESARKLLEFLKLAVPRVRSVALFANPSNEAASRLTKQVGADAATFGMAMQVVEVSGPGDFDIAFASIRSASTESILLPPEPLIRSKRNEIGDFALAHGLPLAVVGGAAALPPGGLLAYGPSFSQYPQLTARYVDRILKGAKPGDLPVEQPSKFELVINMKTAKALGLTVPQSLMLRADEVIR